MDYKKSLWCDSGLCKPLVLILLLDICLVASHFIFNGRLHVPGNKPYYIHLKACVWWFRGQTDPLKVYLPKNSFFFFKPGSKEECNRILHVRPWLLIGDWLFCGLDRAYRVEIYFLCQLRSVFPSFHLNFLTKQITSKVANLIGSSLHGFYNDSSSGECLVFLHCFVDISAINPS